LLNIFLKKSNIEILWAKNGLEAIQIVNENRLDLILMDIKMPVMDGMEATRKIKELKPQLPIIAQTAFAFNYEVEEILKSGIDAYITKPINKSELFDLISKFL